VSSNGIERVGIIGGSGLERLMRLDDARELMVSTPFSPDPVPLLTGAVGGTEVAFLQRHGDGHAIPPHEIDARANIAALAHAGCRQVISVSAVGSLSEDVHPGTFVVVDQFIDRTTRGAQSFFGTGLVAHVPFAEPTCGRLGAAVCEVLESLTVPYRPSGTYVVMEGPQFSTRAESEMHRQFGATLIGMTAMPEAKLAREAQMCYCLVAVPTDYDSWNHGHDAVSAAIVGATMAGLAETAGNVAVSAAQAAAQHTGRCPSGCREALSDAIMTRKDQRNPELLDRLEFVVPDIRTI
jgi:5'-methylthioadenosine phosphorylase